MRRQKAGKSNRAEKHLSRRAAFSVVASKQHGDWLKWEAFVNRSAYYLKGIMICHLGLNALKQKNGERGWN